MADDTYLPETIFETDDVVDGAVEETKSEAERLLEKLLGSQKELNEQLIRARTEPVRGQPLQSEQIAPELFTLDGLPDPTMDLAGFHKGYAERASRAVGNALRQVEQRAAENARRISSDAEVQARADAMIKAANPNLDDDIIGFAATKVAERYRAAGQDPMAVLRARTDEVAQEVLDYTDEMAQKLGGTGRARAEAPHSNRTAGLVAPRARTATQQRGGSDKEDPKAFYNEFTAMQKKARIY